jgi:hypothetical protein
VKDSGHRASVVAALLFAALPGGCFSSSGNNNGNPLGDGGVPDLGDRICNAIQVGNAYVQAMDSGNETLPTATGGVLTDGSYHLTSTSFYPSAACSLDPIAANMVVSSSSSTSGTMQTASLTNVGYFISESTSYLINGTSLNARIDCVAPDSFGVLGTAAQIPYSATATEIQIYGSGGCGNRIDIYDHD